jgi:asparagine synthase (glutamine-hydrolysing)
LRGRRSKHLFKEMLAEWLPPDVLNRRKMGFGVPLDHWFRDRLRNLPADVLLDPRSTARGMFRRSEIERLIAEHAAGTRDHGNKLWALLQLELWFRTYVDTTADAPLALSV